MPKRLMGIALQPYLVTVGQLGVPTLDNNRRSDAERALAEAFDVNPVVARYRINDLYPRPEAGQLTL
jgi:hypothetical protein